MPVIPLHNSYHCLDCDVIGDDSQTCPSCASTALHPVAAWINRPAPLTGLEKEFREYIAEPEVDSDVEEWLERNTKPIIC